MNTNEYLARINYDGALNPSPETLAALQVAHLLAVPFENLDIHTGTRIALEPAGLFHKIVTRKRGGFCYELNAMFHALLQQIGFRAKLVSGRVYDANREDYGPEFDHMLILVEEGGQTWVVDVGFGDFSMRPLKFIVNTVQTDASGRFIIERYSGDSFRVSRYSVSENRPTPEYIFSTRERRVDDFAAMCAYHQSSPDSHFTQKRVCTVATPAGRITLTDDKLIVTADGVRTESPVRDEREFSRLLSHHFGITL